MKNHNKHYEILLWVLLILFSSSLFSMFILASHMRLSGDDYCYNAVLEKEGFWGMQIKSYFEINMYHGNRYSLTFLSGFFGMFPVWGTSILIISSLIAWIGGIFLFLVWFSKKLNLSRRLIEALVLSEGFVCFVLWSTPLIEQSILWRSGMIPYFMPLVCGIWLLLLIVWSAETKKYSLLKLMSIFFLALFIGGFSETGAALQGGYLGCLLILSIFKSKIFEINLKKYSLPTVVANLGTGVAIALLYYSPVTAIRSSELPDPLGFGELVSKLFWHLKIFFWESLMQRPFTIIMPLLFGCGSALLFWGDHHFYNYRRLFKKFRADVLFMSFVLGLTLLFLSGCILLPTTYIYGDYPPERALILLQAVLVAICIIEGGLIASFVISLQKEKDQASDNWRFILHVLGGTMLIFVILIPILLLNSNIGKLEFYSKWSKLWEIRHESLVMASRKNVDEVHVVQLDKIISGVGELSADPDYWYNNCAEMYYGIDAIYADQPGW